MSSAERARTRRRNSRHDDRLQIFAAAVVRRGRRGSRRQPIGQLLAQFGFCVVRLDWRARSCSAPSNRRRCTTIRRGWRVDNSLTRTSWFGRTLSRHKSGGAISNRREWILRRRVHCCQNAASAQTSNVRAAPPSAAALATTSSHCGRAQAGGLQRASSNDADKRRRAQRTFRRARCRSDT